MSVYNSVYNGRASVRTKYTMAKSGLLLNTMPKIWAALNHSTSPVSAYIAQLFSASTTFDDKHGDAKKYPAIMFINQYTIAREHLKDPINDDVSILKNLCMIFLENLSFF